MKNVKRKTKIILPIILICAIFVSGLIIRNYKNSSKGVYSGKTRVVQKQDSKSVEKEIDQKTSETEKTNETEKVDKVEKIDKAEKTNGTEKTDEINEKKENEDKQDQNIEKDNLKEENIKKSNNGKDQTPKIKEENKNSDNEEIQVKENKSSKKTTETEKKSSNNKQVSVYIRVEGYDKTIVPRQKVTTGIFDLNPYLGRATGSSATPSKGWGVDRFKEPTVAHALVKLLEAKGYHGGKGYDLQDYGWSLYIAMINGDREFDYRSTSGWMYRVGDVLPNIGCQGKPIKGGEEILWYFGAYGFDTLVTEIKVDKTNVKVGQPIEITLNGIKNDIKTWKEYREPAKNATIYVNGKAYCNDDKKAITDEKGKTTIKFSKPGKYILSAERVNSKNLKDLVRPLPVTIIVK